MIEHHGIHRTVRHPEDTGIEQSLFSYKGKIRFFLCPNLRLLFSSLSVATDGLQDVCHDSPALAILEYRENRRSLGPNSLIFPFFRSPKIKVSQNTFVSSGHGRYWKPRFSCEGTNRLFPTSQICSCLHRLSTKIIGSGPGNGNVGLFSQTS